MTSHASNHLGSAQQNICQVSGIDTHDICIICGFYINRPYKYKGKLPKHHCKVLVCLECYRRILYQQHKSGVESHFCPFCDAKIDLEEINSIYPELFDIEGEQAVLTKTENLIHCQFCPEVYEYAPPRPDPSLDKTLGDAQRDCYYKNYMICPSCHNSCCRSCGAIPYHSNQTCEEHKWFRSGSVCRFCGNPVNPKNCTKQEMAMLVCSSPSCRKKQTEFCDHILLCGHACVGCKGETNHPFCPFCTIGGSNCPKCRMPLSSFPCVALDCGHVIHRHCAKDLIELSMNGPNLILPLCPVPGCGELVSHEALDVDALEQREKWKALWSQIVECADNRIEVENLKIHPEVMSKVSPYSVVSPNPARSWALKNLRFMICHDRTMHADPLIFTLGRVGDPPIQGQSKDLCPICSNRYPVCLKKCHPSLMAYKCERCCNIGVHFFSRPEETQKDVSEGWYCDYCVDLPVQTGDSISQKCHGNCIFGAHENGIDVSYGFCTHCKEAYQKRHPITFLEK